MSTDRLSRRIAIAAGGAALVLMGSLTACSPAKEKDVPPAPSTSSSPTPTEKALLPGGDQSFTPKVPTPPGAVCKEVVNGVCMR